MAGKRQCMKTQNSFVNRTPQFAVQWRHPVKICGLTELRPTVSLHISPGSVARAARRSSQSFEFLVLSYRRADRSSSLNILPALGRTQKNSTPADGSGRTMAGRMRPETCNLRPSGGQAPVHENSKFFRERDAAIRRPMETLGENMRVKGTAADVRVL